MISIVITCTMWGRYGIFCRFLGRGGGSSDVGDSSKLRGAILDSKLSKRGRKPKIVGKTTRSRKLGGLN